MHSKIEAEKNEITLCKSYSLHLLITNKLPKEPLSIMVCVKLMAIHNFDSEGFKCKRNNSNARVY